MCVCVSIYLSIYLFVCPSIYSLFYIALSRFRGGLGRFLSSFRPFLLFRRAGVPVPEKWQRAAGTGTRERQVHGEAGAGPGTSGASSCPNAPDSPKRRQLKHPRRPESEGLEAQTRSQALSPSPSLFSSHSPCYETPTLHLPPSIWSLEEGLRSCWSVKAAPSSCVRLELLCLRNAYGVSWSPM